ncbi:MAG: hypothetical protein FIB07_04270 [Candidatus Methanoperedens sp.]|nr:hypothetical protein [Candidatus Methanoperedens sp.]
MADALYISVDSLMDYQRGEKMRNYKDISEIDLERVSYLLSTSELLEKMLDEAQSKTTKNTDAKFSEALAPTCI